MPHQGMCYIYAISYHVAILCIVNYPGIIKKTIIVRVLQLIFYVAIVGSATWLERYVNTFFPLLFHLILNCILLNCHAYIKLKLIL